MTERERYEQNTGTTILDVAKAEVKVYKADEKEKVECPQCGKVCKGAGGLKTHLRLVHIVELPYKDKLAIEVIKFYNKLGGRMTANAWDLKQMWNWYHQVYNKDPGDRNCKPCVMHVYKALLGFTNRNRGKYEEFLSGKKIYL